MTPNRRPQLPAFVRGVPIVGQRREPPPGRHFYEVSVLVKREGMPLDAEAIEVQMSEALEGFMYKGLGKLAVKMLKERRPELPEPTVIIVNVWELGFLTEEQLVAADGRSNGRGATP